MSDRPPDSSSVLNSCNKNHEVIYTHIYGIKALNLFVSSFIRK